jgi:hypothetical protein
MSCTFVYDRLAPLQGLLLRKLTFTRSETGEKPSSDPVVVSPMAEKSPGEFLFF